MAEANMSSVFVPYAVPDHAPGKLFRVVETWNVVGSNNDVLIISPGDTFMILATELRNIEGGHVRFTCLGNNGVVWHVWYWIQTLEQYQPFYSSLVRTKFAVPL
jgi:hypothetical protein